MTIRLKLSLTALLFVFFCLISSCVKDKSPNLNVWGECKNKHTELKDYKLDTFPFPAPFGEWTGYNSNNFNYVEPSFNPNNSNQICFRRGSLSTGYDLCTYDMCTGLINKIADNCAFVPTWGSKDWIAYCGTDWQIWVVKSNGDSLKKLTNTGDYNLVPAWNYEGDKIIYEDSRVSCRNFPLRIINLDGKTLDSLAHTTNAISQFLNVEWTKTNTIVYSGRASSGYLSYIFEHNLSTNNKITTDFIEYPTGGHLIGISQVYDIALLDDNDTYIYNDMVKIASYRKSTNTTHNIKIGADNWIYAHLDVSRDGEWIVAQCEKSRYIGNDSLESFGDKLHVINIKTEQEYKLNLPD